MQWVPKAKNEKVQKKIIQLILFIVESGCTKHMTGNLKLLCNFVEKFLGTVCFGNDQFAPILDYGDLVQGNITINWVYYVKGLNHNLFSVGQFCDGFGADAHVPSQQELDLLFGPLYDEFFNAGSNPKDTQPTMNIQPTSAPSTPTYVHAKENNDDQAEEDHLPDDEFTNPFCTPAHEVAESSSYNTGNSNVPTFNQPQVSEYRWTKDHLLEQVLGNPSRPVQTRRQLATDPEICMFALTGSSFGLIAFLDADHAGCIDTRKSTSGRIQFLGDKLVSWMSKKQDCTAMSSAEAEYMALSAICAQVITEYQLADMFTKALPEDRFKYLVRRIGMRCLTPVELEVLEKESA
nr:integrase, catalytic region, zinc finger, CCHC-type, peptidase aspartic, catalytic [Tanacetum cinerariifolium]